MSYRITVDVVDGVAMIAAPEELTAAHARQIGEVFASLARALDGQPVHAAPSRALRAQGLLPPDEQ